MSTGTWDPEAQFSLLMSGGGGAAVPETLGSELLQKALPTTATTASTPPDQSLFYNSYVKPAVAQEDHTKAKADIQQHMDSVVEQYPELSNTVYQSVCQIFPPLLVRYHGTKEEYIPVKLAINGEMRKTYEVPDLILHFRSQSGAITLTICNIDKEQYPRYQLALDTLYAMRSPIPLDLVQFALLYDHTKQKIMSK